MRCFWRFALPTLTVLGLWAGLSAPLAASPLTPLAGGRVAAMPQAQPPTARYDFGTRAATDQSALAQTFTLRNDGKALVTVSRIEPSCGCTTAVLSGDQTIPFALKPGQSVSVEVSVSPGRLAPGPAHKTIWVYTADDDNHPAALLEVDGTIEAGASAYSPDALIPGAARPSFLPKEGHLAPPFSLADTQGKAFTLTAARGHSAALFFFCGCPWCADVARLWAEVQRGSRLPSDAQTVIVFAGTKAEASVFAAKSGLDLARTRLLPDPDSKLTEGTYQANSCPRVFTLDAKGLIRYTNDHADDKPRQSPAKLIVKQALAALGTAGQSVAR